jgi:GH15 family glucan-1,4-alpha-glucosidase
VALGIEDCALNGDCETGALVGKNGSIDWLCWPGFSSPACFVALIGTEQIGRWLLAPKTNCKRITRQYREHTLILETRFETAMGILLVTDFMPARETHSDVVRIARCLEENLYSENARKGSVTKTDEGAADSIQAKSPLLQQRLDTFARTIFVILIFRLQYGGGPYIPSWRLTNTRRTDVNQQE